MAGQDRTNQYLKRAFDSSANALTTIYTDPVNDTFDFYFGQTKGITTLSSPSTQNGTTLVLTSVADVVVGNTLLVFDLSVTPATFQAVEALSIATNTVTIDQRLDYAFPTGASVAVSTHHLNVNGSSTTQIFSAQGGFDVDITRIMLRGTTTNASQFGRFGDILGGLTNGLTLRVYRGATGTYRTLWNSKVNEDFVNLAYDLSLYQASNPQGVNGFGSRYTFAGADKHGAVVRLAVGDRLDLEIRDDLTSLIEFVAMYQGHIVD